MLTLQSLSWGIANQISNFKQTVLRASLEIGAFGSMTSCDRCLIRLEHDHGSCCVCSACGLVVSPKPSYRNCDWILLDFPSRNRGGGVQSSLALQRATRRPTLSPRRLCAPDPGRRREWRRIWRRKRHVRVDIGVRVRKRLEAHMRSMWLGESPWHEDVGKNREYTKKVRAR